MENIPISEIPQQTADSLEKFWEEHVDGREDRAYLVGIEMPKNEAEFREITKKLYGVELGVECFAYPSSSFSNHEYAASYEIVWGDGEDRYASEGLMPLWEKKFTQYDGLKPLLNPCFGRLFCGGVARVHYGQTELDKDGYERIKNWGESQKNYVKHVVAQHNEMVSIFGHDPFL